MVTPEAPWPRATRRSGARASASSARRRRQGAARVRVGAAGHLPKLDAKLIEKALPGGKAQIGAYKLQEYLGKASSLLFTPV